MLFMYKSVAAYPFQFGLGTPLCIGEIYFPGWTEQEISKQSISLFIENSSFERHSLNFWFESAWNSLSLSKHSCWWICCYSKSWTGDGLWWSSFQITFWTNERFTHGRAPQTTDVLLKTLNILDFNICMFGIASSVSQKQTLEWHDIVSYVRTRRVPTGKLISHRQTAFPPAK